jgi:hypothetical protein
MLIVTPARRWPALVSGHFHGGQIRNERGVWHSGLEIRRGYVKQVDIVGDDRWTRRQRHRAE